MSVMAKQPITSAQFYEALGLAVANWSRVEDALCDLFIRLTICALTGGGMGVGPKGELPTGDGIFMLGNIYYATSNFRGRLDLMDHMFRRVVHDEPLLAEWNAIRNKAGTLYQRRNVLAHGTAWAGDNSDPEFIRYSIFKMSARQSMDYQRMCVATPSFFRFSKRVEQLAINANAYLHARPQSHPEDAAH
jgi:hypothetical protein